MHIMIFGAAGMVGRKLALTIARTSTLGGQNVGQLTLVDIVEPAVPEGFGGTTSLRVADMSLTVSVVELIAARPDVIFHLASIVSGEAEVDFDKGYRINLGGTQNLLEAIRAEAENTSYRPRFIFTSSIAVFGKPMPTVISDDFRLTPQTSYGTQKAICELLLNDYSRKGIIDGIGIRLPTVCIRPGLANLAASSFFSGILREPLAGKEAILPVDETVRHWHASPRAAVDFLIHAATLDTDLLGNWRNLSMPGLSATVGEQIDALQRIAGSKTVALIKHEPNPEIKKIVEGWPQGFDAARAIALGFVGEQSFDEIIQTYIEEEFGGNRPGLG